MSDTAALVAAAADTHQTWSRNGGPPTEHLSTEEDPPFVAPAGAPASAPVTRLQRPHSRNDIEAGTQARQ